MVGHHSVMPDPAPCPQCPALPVPRPARLQLALRRVYLFIIFLLYFSMPQGSKPNIVVTGKSGVRLAKIAVTSSGSPMAGLKVRPPALFCELGATAPHGRAVKMIYALNAPFGGHCAREGGEPDFSMQPRIFVCLGFRFPAAQLLRNPHISAVCACRRLLDPPGLSACQDLVSPSSPSSPAEMASPPHRATHGIRFRPQTCLYKESPACKRLRCVAAHRHWAPAPSARGTGTSSGRARRRPRSTRSFAASFSARRWAVRIWTWVCKRRL